MPNSQNTIQTTVSRGGTTYLETYELAQDTIEPAARVAASFEMTPEKLFQADQEGTLPGQADLLSQDDRRRLKLKLKIVDVDPQILRALQRQAKLYKAESIEEYLEDAVLGVLLSDEANIILDQTGQDACLSLGGPGSELVKAEERS